MDASSQCIHPECIWTKRTPANTYELVTLGAARQEIFKKFLRERIIAWLPISGCSVTNPVLFPRFPTQPITHQLRLTKYHHLLVFPWQRLSALHRFHGASKFSSLALEFMRKAIIPQNLLQQCLLLLCPRCKHASASDAQVLDGKYSAAYPHGGYG